MANDPLSPIQHNNPTNCIGNILRSGYIRKKITTILNTVILNYVRSKLSDMLFKHLSYK